MPLFGSLFGMGGGALGPQEQGLPVLEAVDLADLGVRGIGNFIGMVQKLCRL